MFAVLRQRNFALLWIGQFVSLVGDWLVIVALPFYVLHLTGSVLQTGLLLLAELLPRIALGSLAGVFVDRWDRRRTMIVSDLLRASVLLLLLLVHSRDQLWLIYVVSLVQAVIAQFFEPASKALIPHLVKERQLIAANALASFNDAVSRLIGPALGGLLLVISGLTGVVLLDSATFLFSALMVMLISLPLELAKQQSKATAVMPALWHGWLKGLRLVGADRVICGVFLTGGVIFLAQGILNVILVVFISRVMHGNALVFGWMITAQGVGSLIGALLVGTVSKLLRPVYLLAPGPLISGILLGVIANVPVVTVALPLVALIGLFVVGFVVTEQALLQSGVEDEYRGRIFGAFTTTTSMLMLIGMVLDSALGDTLSPVLLLEGAAGLLVMSSALALVFLRTATIATQPKRADQETMG